ncbi:site-specific integrase [Lactobacillus johnsonii]|nr:tyrosine-type recombinase/integrase [Lactobacillus johnsonii]UOC07317.1 site-specific integrase [Lactobacillus johnsonii]
MAKPTNQGKVIGQGTSYDLPEYEAESIKKSETVKESTLATTTNIFNNHILPVLGNIYVDKLTVAKFQSIAQQWRKEAPRTFKRYIRYANNVLDYGVNLELLVSNPMRKIVRPKVKRQVKKQFNDFYNKEELETFLQDCKACKSTKIFTFFRVLAYSEMRKEEILALTWNDIDFNKNTISIIAKQ